MRLAYAVCAVLLFLLVFYAFGTRIGLDAFDFDKFMLLIAIVAAGAMAGGD